MLYANVKRVAKEKGIPIYKIEDDCGYQRGAISKWKTSSPTANRLKVVADYLGVTVDYLLNTEDKKELQEVQEWKSRTKRNCSTR